MFWLFCLGVSVLVGNAEAERVFITKNGIKAGLRKRLSIERLDQLIRTSYDNVARDEFDFAHELFTNTVQRRI